MGLEIYIIMILGLIMIGVIALLSSGKYCTYKDEHKFKKPYGIDCFHGGPVILRECMFCGYAEKKVVGRTKWHDARLMPRQMINKEQRKNK